MFVRAAANDFFVAAEFELLGRNGTGKTTLIDTLVGVTTRHAGRIALVGRSIDTLPVYARVLVLNPKLLLLDEPLEGLAPIIVEELLRAV